ncbi:MAG: hypothetical protein JSS51_04010 [Planctomycetes bacterium]|nr:hypothetical protein [Planctomycetota bacterium]
MISTQQQNERITQLVGLGQVQEALYSVAMRRQRLFIDGQLYPLYPPQLQQYLQTTLDMLDTAWSDESACVEDARAATIAAMNDFALSVETLGPDSGLLDDIGTPKVSINAPTAQILVDREYWGQAELDRAVRFRARVNDLTALETALEYWVVDFANFMQKNPSGPPPTWEWLTQRYPVPTPTAPSGSALGLPGWVWLALGAVALLFAG